MMEAVRTSETSVNNHFTRQYNPEDNSEHHTRRRENLKSHINYVKTNDTDIEKLPFNPDVFTESYFLADERNQEVAIEEDSINQGPLVSPGDIMPVTRINEPVSSTVRIPGESPC
jgi:hypothetical protein